MRNFRTTKRKRGGMPPRLDERTINYLQGLKRRLENDKKQKNESPRQTLEFTQAAYDNYLVVQADNEAKKKQAAEKALADAKAKAASDVKAKTEAATKAKTEAATKAAQAKIAAVEQAKIAADNAIKIAADAEILEQKRLQKALDEAAKEERKKIRAEAEKVAAEEAAAASFISFCGIGIGIPNFLYFSISCSCGVILLFY